MVATTFRGHQSRWTLWLQPPSEPRSRPDITEYIRVVTAMTSTRMVHRIPLYLGGSNLCRPFFRVRLIFTLVRTLIGDVRSDSLYPSGRDVLFCIFIFIFKSSGDNSTTIGLKCNYIPYRHHLLCVSSITKISILLSKCKSIGNRLITISIVTYQTGSWT